MATWEELNKQANGGTATISQGWAALNAQAQKTLPQQQFQQAQQVSQQMNSPMGLLKGTLSSAGGILNSAYQGMKAPLLGVQEAGIATGQALQQGQGRQALASGLQLGTRVVGASFAPINAANAFAQEVPLLKPVANVLNKPFEMVGFLGETFGREFVNDLRVSEETKQILRPAFEEVGSLAGQFWLGGKIGEIAKSKTVIEKPTIDILKEQAKRIEVQNQTPEAQRVMVNPKPLEVRNQTPREVPVETKTPYTPPEQLPTVQLGGYAKEKPVIPQIQLQPKTKPVDLGYTVEPIREPLLAKSQQIQPSETLYRGNSGKPLVGDKPLSSTYYTRDKNIAKNYGTVESIDTKGLKIATEADLKRLGIQRVIKDENGIGQVNNKIDAQLKRAGFDGIDDTGWAFDEVSEIRLWNKPKTPILAKENQIKRTSTALKPIEGTGATKTRGLSQGVEIKALQNDLTKGFGDLPDYKQVNMHEQAVRANDLLMKDIESAKSIAMGEKAPPKGLLPESVFVALEKQAIRDGDVATLRQLATDSKLSSSATTMGQRIRSLGERDVDSPVGAIADIIKAREEALKGKDIPKAKKEVVDEIKSEIKKVRVPKETWNSFIDSLAC